MEPQARGPAPGGMTASLADRFVGQLTPAAVEVLVVLFRQAPEVTYEQFQAAVQAQLGIGRDRLGGVLTALAGARKRLPRNVDYPIRAGQGTAPLPDRAGAAALPLGRSSGLAPPDW